MDCVFCKKIDKSQSAFSLENEQCGLILLEKSVLEGTGIIIPKAHRADMFEMTSKELASTFSLLTQVKTYLSKKYSPQGFCLGWNCGSTAGQCIEHAHLFVIPRYDDEPLVGRGIDYIFRQEENRRPGGDLLLIDSLEEYLK